MVHSFCGVGKSVAKSVGDRRVDRPESGLRPDLLALLGVQEVLQRGGLVQVCAGGDDRDRVLDLEGLRRVDVLDGLALPLDVDRLVLVGDQHVTGALQEHVGGLAAGTGTRLDVLGDQLGDEVQAGLLVLRRRCSWRRTAPSRFHLAEPELSGLGVTTSIPGCSRSSQSLMFFGLPLRTTRETTDPNGMPLGGVGVPVLVHLVGLDQAGDVRLDREVHDVGGLAVDDGARLVTRGAVGRRHRDALALGRGRERRDDLAPARLGHRVGDERQRGLGGRLIAAACDVAGAAAAGREQRRCGGQDGGIPPGLTDGGHWWPFLAGGRNGWPVTTARRGISTWA